MTPNLSTELVSQYLDEGLSENKQVELDDWLNECPDNQAAFAAQVDLAAQLMLSEVDAVELPLGGLEKLLEAISNSEQETTASPLTESDHFGKEQTPSTLGGFSYLLEKDSPWIELPSKGNRIRTLSDHPDDPFTIIVLEMDPGAVFPHHRHRGVETGYVLHGDLEMNGRVYGKGDFMRAEPGSNHPDFNSPSGCQALLVMARENYPRKRLRALKIFNKLGAHRQIV